MKQMRVCLFLFTILLVMLAACSEQSSSLSQTEDAVTIQESANSVSDSGSSDNDSSKISLNEDDKKMRKEELIAFAEETDANPVVITPDKTISIGETAEWVIEDFGTRLGEMDYCLKRVNTFTDVNSAGFPDKIIAALDSEQVKQDGELEAGYILVSADVEVTNIDFPLMENEWNVTGIGLVENYEDNTPALKLQTPYLLNGDWEYGDRQYYDVTLEPGSPRTFTLAWIVDTSIYSPEKLYLAIGVDFGAAEGYSDPRKFYHLGL